MPVTRRDAPHGSAPDAPRGPAPAPYRFVPASRAVYFPDWSAEAEQAHDAPFEDGISGTLTLRVTAHSPILVAREAGADGPRDFCRYGGELAIPGSSLRGMLRNVVEIASFGKLGTYVADQQLSIRDMHNAHVYRQHVTESTGRGYRARAESGFLEVHEGAWRIRPCKHARPRIVDLEQFARDKRGKSVQLGSRQRGREKYRQWGTTPDDLTIRFDLEDPDKPGLDYRLAVNLGKGEHEGQLVLTGQPMDLRNRGSKKREFVFYEPTEDDEKLVPVSDELRRAFEEIHAEGRERHGLPKPNQEWELLREWLREPDPRRRVPVFFLRDKKSRVLLTVGLAQLPRLRYTNSVHDALRNTSPGHTSNDRPDLAELIFGRVVKRGTALRGRVSFEPLWHDGKTHEGSVVTTVLSGPRASYYPYYVAQPSAQGDRVPERPLPGESRPQPVYATLMDVDAEVAGWKRYPARTEARPWPADGVSRALQSRLRPLPQGSVFQGQVHVHNLRRVELGALLWAITWGQSPGLRHALGMGKPFGWGQLSVTVEAADLERAHDGRPEPNWTDLIGEFECHMETAARVLVGEAPEGPTPPAGRTLAAWRSSEQLVQLLALATPARAPAELRHGRLDDKSRVNEFKDVKKEGQVLRPAVAVDERDRDRSLYRRPTAQDRAAAEHARLAAEEAERKRAEEAKREAAAAAEAAARQALGPIGRFNEKAAGETNVGNLWLALQGEAEAALSAGLGPALLAAANDHATLGPQLRTWEEQGVSEPRPGTPEFAALTSKKQDKAQKLHVKLDLLRRLRGA